MRMHRGTENELGFLFALFPHAVLFQTYLKSKSHLFVFGT